MVNPVARPSMPSKKLKALVIPTIQCRRPVFRALHRYLELEGCSHSEEASETAISIPIYPSMTDEDVARTAHALRGALA